MSKVGWRTIKIREKHLTDIVPSTQTPSTTVNDDTIEKTRKNVESEMIKALLMHAQTIQKNERSEIAQTIADKSKEDISIFLNDKFQDAATEAVNAINDTRAKKPGQPVKDIMEELIANGYTALKAQLCQPPYDKLMRYKSIPTPSSFSSITPGADQHTNALKASKLCGIPCPIL
jgi:hypothetical protein